MKHNRNRSSAWSRRCRRGLCDDIRLTAIKRMKLIYYRLWRAAEHTNDFFGWTIAGVMILNFVATCCALYWGYLILVSKEHPKSIDFSVIGPIICAIMPFFSSVTLIGSAQKLYAQVCYSTSFIAREK